jgi:4-methyl-5(b-hydroxyethyl)-thiazole monophosphate biosynthesis
MDAEHSVLVPLADGFEEIEFATIVDVLRRAELRVTTASLRPGPVGGAHGIRVLADVDWSEIDPASFTVLVLPGGQPGTDNLVADARVVELARSMESRRLHVAAICAAPLVLHAAGILRGRRATAFPSARPRLAGADVVADEVVVRDRLVTTSQGAGTAMEFALDLVAQLVNASRADTLRKSMIAADARSRPGV